MRHSAFYILDGHNLVPVDLVTFEEWRERHKDELQIAHSELPDGRSVSTVFTGRNLEHLTKPPIVFETIIHGGAFNGWTTGYSTYEEALKGHNGWVKTLRDKG